jgi:hypothetical protein
MTDTPNELGRDTAPRFAPTLEGIALELGLCAEPGFPVLPVEFAEVAWRRLAAFLGLRPVAEATDA